MADTGYVTAGTGANNADAGNTAWSNPGNITTATDSANASANNITKSGTSQYLHATNFDFSSIPVGATIDGIDVLRREGSSTANVQDHTVQLIVGGTRSGDNKATGTTWTTSASTETFGGASDLWGLSLSRADVVASNFGVAIRATNISGSAQPTARIYYVQIKVHYTEAAGNTGAFFALFSVKDRIREILKPRKKFWLPEPVFARAA